MEEKEKWDKFKKWVKFEAVGVDLAKFENLGILQKIKELEE